MSDTPGMPYCKVCGFTGSLDDKHLEFTHSAINALWGEVKKRDKIVNALREIIKGQKKSHLILELQRELGARRAWMSEALETLNTIKAQSSGVPGSVAKADCMAALASAFLQRTTL